MKISKLSALLLLASVLIITSCKNEIAPKVKLIDSPDIAWASQLRINVYPDDKGYNELLSAAENLWTKADAGTIPVYKYGTGSDPYELVKLENFKTTSYDTVLLIDPETYAEQKEIVKQVKTLKNLNHIAVYTEMYYLATTNKMINKVKYVAPIESVYDEAGNYRGTKALGYFSVNKADATEFSNGNKIASVAAKIVTDNDHYAKPIKTNVGQNLISVVLKNNSPNKVSAGCKFENGVITIEDKLPFELDEEMKEKLNSRISLTTCDKNILEFDLFYDVQKNIFNMKSKKLTPYNVVENDGDEFSFNLLEVDLN